MENYSLRESLITVAKLYYTGDFSQEQIAEILNISRPKVSRMLKMCREMKIVQFQISTSPSHYTMLAKKIKHHFNLKDVMVVPSEPSMEICKRNVGKRAAQYLNECLENNMQIGIAWGTTLGAFVSEFIEEKAPTGCQVVQLTGGLHSQSINMDGREMAKALAIRINAGWYLMQAPLVVQSKLLRDLLMQEPEIQRNFQMFESLNIAFVGLGSCHPEQSMTYKAGYISLEESNELIRTRAIGDICGHRLTMDGQVPNTFLTDRILAIDLECLKKVPRIVAVGAGEDKAFSIIAAARGGFINTLVIDELAAMSVIGFAKIQ